MNEATVLLVTHDPSLIQAVGQALDRVSHLRLRVSPQMEEACLLLRDPAVALMLVHLSNRQEGGRTINLMKDLAFSRRTIVTVAISEEYDAEEALTFLRLGAADYLERPLDIARLAYLFDVFTVRVRHNLLRLAEAGGANEAPTSSFICLPATAMGQVMEQVRRAAPQNTTILLQGETGTGKTHLARLIHDLSPRRAEPFVVVNCGTLSPTLIESELYGHVKGAFTGADRERTGKFTQAGQGTLLLDDIEALPLEVQGRLLRVLEDRIFEPLGGNRQVVLQARLIAASNKLLDQEVAAARFRCDLFYRLNVVSFFLPPLREWTAGLPTLVNHFLQEMGKTAPHPTPSVSGEVLALLGAYHWPGNIRELHNVIERAVVLCAGPRIEKEDLPEAIRGLAAAAATQGKAIHLLEANLANPTLTEAKDAAEARLMTEVLRRHNNNRSRAAAELGICRMTLYKKMRRYGLNGPN